MIDCTELLSPCYSISSERFCLMYTYTTSTSVTWWYLLTLFYKDTTVETWTPTGFFGEVKKSDDRIFVTKIPTIPNFVRWSYYLKSTEGALSNSFIRVYTKKVVVVVHKQLHYK